MTEKTHTIIRNITIIILALLVLLMFATFPVTIFIALCGLGAAAVLYGLYVIFTP